MDRPSYKETQREREREREREGLWLSTMQEKKWRKSADKGLWLSTTENKMEESVGPMLSNPEKLNKMKKRNQFYTNRNLNTSLYSPKSTRTTRNGPKFFPRWNKEVSHLGLPTGTVFSGHSGQNRTEFRTMVQWRCLKTAERHSTKDPEVLHLSTQMYQNCI